MRILNYLLSVKQTLSIVKRKPQCQRQSAIDFAPWKLIFYIMMKVEIRKRRSHIMSKMTACKISISQGLDF